MTNTLQCKFAQDENDRKQVYRLRYQCYRRDESIQPNDTQLFRDEIDSDPNHFSFLVQETAQRSVATVRISVIRPDLGWHDSPCLHVFGDQRALQAISRESFVEASRLCFAEQARRDAFLRLLAYMSAMADFYAVDWLVACPRVEHADVYRHLFGFQTLAEPRPYYGVNFKTGLLAVRRSALREYVGQKKKMTTACEAAFQTLNRSYSSAFQPLPNLLVAEQSGIHA